MEKIKKIIKKCDGCSLCVGRGHWAYQKLGRHKFCTECYLTLQKRGFLYIKDVNQGDSLFLVKKDKNNICKCVVNTYKIRKASSAEEIKKILLQQLKKTGLISA